MIRDELWLFIKCDGKWRNVISQGRDHPCKASAMIDDTSISQSEPAEAQSSHPPCLFRFRGGPRGAESNPSHFQHPKKIKKHSKLKFFSNCFELIRMHQPHTWENWEEFLNNRYSPPTLLSSCFQWTGYKTFWHLEKLEKWPAQLVEWENLQLRQNWSD